MVEPIIRNYDKRTHKKCIKCRAWKAREDILDDEGNLVEKRGFGLHNSSDGLQSICHTCKNAANVVSRAQNSTARVRHHISTRCAAQLGDLFPEEFTKNIEDYLGYRIKTLINSLRDKIKAREGPDRKLRDALNEGYHIDHIIPLSSFKVIIDEVEDAHRSATHQVDWYVFKECWAIENLEAIPAEVNLAKGSKTDLARIDAMTDEDIAQQIEDNPDAAPFPDLPEANAEVSDEEETPVDLPDETEAGGNSE